MSTDKTNENGQNSSQIEQAKQIDSRVGDILDGLGDLSYIGVKVKEPEKIGVGSYQIVRNQDDSEEPVFQVDTSKYLFSNIPNYLDTQEGEEDLIFRAVDSITDNIAVSREDLNNLLVKNRKITSPVAALRLVQNVLLKDLDRQHQREQQGDITFNPKDLDFLERCKDAVMKLNGHEVDDSWKTNDWFYFKLGTSRDIYQSLLSFSL